MQSSVKVNNVNYKRDEIIRENINHSDPDGKSTSMPATSLLNPQFDCKSSLSRQYFKESDDPSFHKSFENDVKKHGAIGRPVGLGPIPEDSWKERYSSDN